LSLPASGRLRAIATELSARVAEQLGARAQGGTVVAAIEDLAGQVAPSGDGDLALEFHKVDGELKIEARAGGRASEARIPLPA
jgi:hypothetical protein